MQQKSPMMYATEAQIPGRLTLVPHTLAELKVQAAITPAAVGPDASYGCVDWFIYPDPKDQSEPPAAVAEPA
jgi:hypothetical protein